MSDRAGGKIAPTVLELIGPGYVAALSRPPSIAQSTAVPPCAETSKHATVCRYIAAVPDFLSDEWLDSFDRALRADPTVAARFAGSPIAIAQEVTSETGARRGYVVVLDGQGGRLARDGALGDVTFVCNRVTAAALARGELNAQRALTSGRLKLRGDVDRLGAAASALAALADLLADLRADTTF